MRCLQADTRIDPESLERDNDRDIDLLADKTSFLRKVRLCQHLSLTHFAYKRTDFMILIQCHA